MKVCWTLSISPNRAQLTHTYTTGIRRNDQSLFHYGFIQECDPPALVEQDLPDGNLYDVSSYSEADYGEQPRQCCLHKARLYAAPLRFHAAFPHA